MQRQFLLKENFNFHIILYQPDIPPNTGNIARLCVATNSHLHIIKPMGFSLDDRHLKRAGLDYWKHLDMTIHNCEEEFFDFAKNVTIYFATTKSDKTFFDVQYKKGDMFMFGSETKGLPEKLLMNNIERCINIPTTDNVRSINLSDSVSVILYEAIRQVGFSR